MALEPLLGAIENEAGEASGGQSALLVPRVFREDVHLGLPERARECEKE